MTAHSNGCVSRDGDDVYYETFGAPDAPVVVLGHGAGGNHAIWFQQVPLLARDYRVVTWDQRGFGLSTNHHELANPRTATDDLLAILDHLGIERAHVVGQSMGGWAALGLALAHADRVRSLVLADTIGGIAIDGWWKTAVAVAPRVGMFNHTALSDEFCLRNPERAHLYLQIGGLRRDPFADPTRLLRTPRRGDLLRRRRRRAAHPHVVHRGQRRRALPARRRSRTPRPGSRAPGSSSWRAPVTRRTSSNPTRGTPWSRASWRPALAR